MQPLFRAIVHIHTHNIAHRDIKPDNIMINPQGHIKLIDFGFAKKNMRVDKKGEGFEEVLGTPFYVAPEVIMGNYGKECDYWSLGVLLCVLLSGTYPY